MSELPNDLCLIESLVRSKAGDPASSEDVLYVGPHFVAVIDGATSKSDISWERASPGRLAALLVLEGMEALEPRCTFMEAMRVLSGPIRAFYEANGLVAHMEQHPSDRLTASAVIYSKHWRQLWFVGDCQALVGGQHYDNPHIIDDIMSETRRAYLTAELLKGTTVEELQIYDPGKHVISANLKMQCFYQNSLQAGDLGYSCLNGFEVEPSQTKVIQLGSEEVEVVLASDGYPRIFPTLVETEEYLHHQLRVDPLMIGRHRSTKGKYLNMESFDDRLYVRFRALCQR